MKSIYACFIICITTSYCTESFAQNVGIGTSTPAARLDINATDEGILIPRVQLQATNAANPLTNPVVSELVYNTATAGTSPNAVTPGFYYWNGTEWIRFDEAGAPVVTGGDGDWYATGTTNSPGAFDFSMYTDKTVGIGYGSFSAFDTPYEQLHVQSSAYIGVPNSNYAATSSNLYSALNLAKTDNTHLIIEDIDDNVAGFSVDGGGINVVTESGGIDFRTGVIAATFPSLGDFSTTGTSRMIIEAGGDVGIGTIVPDYNLDVRGADADDGAIFQIGNSDQSHFVRLYGGRQNDPEPYILWKSGDPLRLATDNSGFSEKMRIESDGKVGINTDNPDEMLDVNGRIRMRTGAASGYLPISDAGGSMQWTPPTAYINTDEQNLSLLAGNILSLTNDATTVNLTSYLDNTDEQGIDLLNLSGTNLEVSLENDGQTPYTLDLSSFMDNTDNQDLSLAGNTLSLTGDATTVSLSPFLDNTDNQNLSSSVSGTNRTINISGGTGTTISVADNDNSTSNELQTLSGGGTSITLSNGGGTVTGLGDNLGNHTATTHINANDYEVRNMKAINGKDWDDNTGGTDNKYRLLFRDGAHMFYDGGVVVGNYGNGTWTDLANGTLIVEESAGIGKTSVRSDTRLDVNGAVGTSRMGIGGTYNSTEVQGIWSIAPNYKISTANNDFGSQYGITYAHTNSGTSGSKNAISGWGHQIGFTSNGTRNAVISMSSGHGYFAGNLGIGTTAPSAELHVDGGTSTDVIVESDNAGISTLSLRGTSQGSGMLFVGQSATYGGGISYSGDGTPTMVGGTDRVTLFRRSNGTDYDVMSYSYNSNNVLINGRLTTDGIKETSDKRYKRNIESIENGLATINDMVGVTYNWKVKDYPEKDFDLEKQYGLIAQDVEKIVPELVGTDESGYKSISYTHIVPILIEAIKELSNQLEEKDKAINTLKGTMESATAESNEALDDLKEKVDKLYELLELRSKK